MSATTRLGIETRRLALFGTEPKILKCAWIARVNFRSKSAYLHTFEKKRFIFDLPQPQLAAIAGSNN